MYFIKKLPIWIYCKKKKKLTFRMSNKKITDFNFSNISILSKQLNILIRWWFYSVINNFVEHEYCIYLYIKKLQTLYLKTFEFRFVVN